MKKKLTAVLISAAVILGVLTALTVSANTGESYMFRLSDPEGSAVFAEGAEAVSSETGLYRTDDRSLVRKLDSLGLLSEWDVDCEVTLDGIADDIEAQQAEDYRAAMLGCSYIRKNGVTGKNIKIAIVDSGLWSGFSNMTDAEILVGINYFADEDSDERYDTEDTYGHGTFVASVICGEGIGLASEVSILPLRCFSESSSEYSYIIAAIDEAVAQGCDVLSLSFGAKKKNDMLENALNRALDAGIIIVASSSNLASSKISDGDDALYYPASYDGVISVGCTDSQKIIWQRSVQNEKVCVAAPGVNVSGFSTDGEIITGSGTSYSTPVVSAMAALALSVDPDLTRDEFISLLVETSEDLGAEGRDNSYGYGLVNPALMLAYLLRDDESIIITGWDGKLGAAAYMMPDASSPLLAAYDDSGRLIGTVETGVPCFAELPDGCSSIKLYSLGDLFEPVDEVRSLDLR